jgi:HTH-type transcriptional regulator/antitoxin HigA
MTIRPIENETDYNEALERLNSIFDSPQNTLEGDEAELLILLIENYESEHHAVENPDPK